MGFDVSMTGTTRGTGMRSPVVPDVPRFVEALKVEIAGEKLDLPSFPEVAVRVRRALTNEQANIEDVVRVVSAEPALAARLMQLANSAALNPNGKRLSDLRTGISRIGFNMARSATIAFAMSQLRRAEAYKGIEVPLTAMWQQSAHVAAICRVVAKRFSRINPDVALLAGLLRGVGELYILTRAVRAPGMLDDAGVYQRVVAEWQGPIAQAILRNWDVAEEIGVAVAACEDVDREHNGAIDLADVLAVARALAELGPDPLPEQMLFLGMPAARRMHLDSIACMAALAESHVEIATLRQALGS